MGGDVFDRGEVRLHDRDTLDRMQHPVACTAGKRLMYRELVDG